MNATAKSVPRTDATALGVCTSNPFALPGTILTSERSLPVKSSIIESATLVTARSITIELPSESVSWLQAINSTVTRDFSEVGILSPTRIGMPDAAAIERPLRCTPAAPRKSLIVPAPACAAALPRRQYKSRQHHNNDRQ